MKPNVTRRTLILNLAGLLVAGPALAERLRPTPRQTAGPFYPVESPLDDDNDLVQVSGREGLANGEITHLNGHILDLNGEPLKGLRVEIWQCDANGRYRHPYDRGGLPRDENFQGFGHTIADSEGRYRFRTIRPVPYPGRTPHIHMAVFPHGAPPFITQLYVAGEPRNERDFLYVRVPADKRPLLTAEFLPSQAEGARLSASFDIVLGGGDGTPAG